MSGVALIGWRVVGRDLFAGDLDAGVGADGFGNLIVGLALRAKGFNLVADHADEGFNGEHFGAEAGEFAQGFLARTASSTG